MTGVYREVVKIDAEVIEEELPPQLLQKDLELWYVYGLLKSHYKVHTILSRYGSNSSNGFVGVLPVVNLDALILLAVFMGGDGGLGHHHLINVDNMKAIIISTLQRFPYLGNLEPYLPSLDVCKYLSYPDFLFSNLMFFIDLL